MENFKSTIDEIYEFFDEIIGSIVPGSYFCSYIFFNIIAVSYAFKFNFGQINTMAVLFVLSIAYVIGTMFRRSNSKEPDFRSAKYIYYKSCPHDDNDYAFGILLSNDDFKDIIESFKELAKNNKIKYNNSIIEKRCKKRELMFKKAKNRKKLSKPYVLRYIHKRLKKKLKKLEHNPKKNENKINEIQRYIKNNNLSSYAFIYVDYPYNNLKNYLSERKLNHLLDYIDWDMENDDSTTARSKSMICNMKIEIRHKSRKDYGQLLKAEAHIRFMNAMWYANKTLFKLIRAISILSGILYIFFVAVVNNNLLAKLYKHNNTLTNQVELTVSTIKRIFQTIYPDGNFANNILLSTMLIFLISIVYLIFWSLIRKTIINNFHYQRIREVVSVLHLYYLLKNENDSENNKQKESKNERKNI